MDYLKCPICRKNSAFLWTVTRDYQNSKNTKEYKAYKCFDCKIIFQNPFPQESDFDDIYPENYYAHVENGQIPFLTRLLKSFLQGEKRFLAFFLKNTLFPYFDVMRKSNKVLDIGCGKGLFLDILKSQGKETHGLEPDDNATQILLKHGHKVHSDITQIDNDSFDLITMFQVFEHIENPTALVDEIKRILKPEGYFVIETPNAASLPAKSKDCWRALEFPRHLILHTPKSLEHLLEKENFQAKIFIRVSPTDIRESFFLKRPNVSLFKRKILSIWVLLYTLLQYFFNAKNGSLLISISKKTG
jgi:2-polyprenyl-3-methyl-5-hydroxy-6-metoxy-1,4-benzoquinol methylase